MSKEIFVHFAFEIRTKIYKSFKLSRMFTFAKIKNWKTKKITPPIPSENMGNIRLLFFRCFLLLGLLFGVDISWICILKPVPMFWF